jgi:O-antigen ligase
MNLFHSKKQLSHQGVDDIFRIAIEFLILAIIWLVPVYFGFWIKNNSPFELNKVVIFRTLAEILFLAYILRILILKKIEIRFSKWQILLPSFFILAWAAAAIFSFSPHLSFWGHYFRQQGLFTCLHYFVFFFIVLQCYDISGLQVRKRFLITILSSSALICLYGLVQYFGFDFIAWNQPTVLFRINSALGQPNNLGLYLILVIPITIYSIIFFSKFYSKLIIISILSLQLIVLFLTYSRSAWLGFAFMILAGVIFLLLKFKYKKIYYLLLFIIFVSFLTFLTVLFTHKIKIDASKELSFKNRIQSLLVLDIGSNKNRLIIYQNAIDAIKQRPLIGWGPETMWQWYYRFYNKDILYTELYNKNFDRTHNEILDVLAFGGSIGLLAYLELILYLMTAGLKQIKRAMYLKNEENLILFLILGLFAYFVGLQLNFSITATNIFFWFYAALIFVLINQANNARTKTFPINLKNLIKIPLLVLSSILIIFLIRQFNINKLIADIYFFRGVAGQYKGQSIFEASKNYLKSMELDPREDYYRINYAENIVNIFNNTVACEKKINILRSVNDMMGSLPADRRNFSANIVLLKSRAYVEKCESKLDLKKLDKDIKEFENASPDFIQIIAEMGDLYYNIGEYGRAIAEYKKAIRLFPDLSDPRLNSEQVAAISNELIRLKRLINLADFYAKQP